ncbi:MAG: queuine tRNA-ribosyltransferase containing PUA domain protein, partial [Methanosarcinaceae archaeon]|nr:queuine tRNA-ribosyltransferase containing PUA domain protein [Methanosarcinaceae archaeon]
ANEWILTEYEPPVRDVCVFVPCSRKKPYHESPSHRIFDRVIFSTLKPEDVHVVVFGTCGVTPRELDTEYPFMDYKFMLGRCNVPKIKRDFIKMETERLARYLEKTRNNYKHRIAYCIGYFRTAMENAVELVDVHVDIVPKKSSIEENIRMDKKFIYGSLNQKNYLQDFADAVNTAAGNPVRAVSTDDETAVNDADWYIL